MRKYRQKDDYTVNNGVIDEEKKQQLVKLIHQNNTSKPKEFGLDEKFNKVKNNAKAYR